MPKRPSPHPTEAELEVLAILWKKGPATVRDIHDVVLTQRHTSLTTTLKTLQVMAQKEFVVRTDDRPCRYSAAVPEEITQSAMLQDLLEKAFQGSTQKLMLRLVNTAGVTPEELKELARLIRESHKQSRGER
jgi:BlaI family transcriptional regulator, penicillinase repressor